MSHLTALSLCAFAAALTVRFADPLVTDMARSFQTTPEHMALIASAFALPYAFAQLVLGPLSDAAGKGRVMAVCLAALTVALALSAIAPTPDALFAARLVAGAAAGGTIPIALAIVGDSVGVEGRQVALSRLLLGMLTGHLTGTLLAGLVGDAYGWRTVMWLGCGLIAAATSVALAFVTPMVKPGTGVLTFSSVRTGYERVFENPRAIVCFIAVAIGGTALFGLLPHVASMLEARGVGSVREAGFIAAAAGLGGIIYTLSVKYLLARLGGQSNMIRVGGITAGTGFLLAALSPGWQSEAFAFVVLGLGFYMVHNSLQTQATELAPDARGAAVSLHAFAFFMGQATGPPLYAAGIRTVGPFATLCVAGAIMAATGLVLASALTRIGRQT
ncbi:MAG: MFS transporter [Hyphomicrobiaceae bacterium]|nr:MFS transporter [Hyphomicrobiaceae bacterium]